LSLVSGKVGHPGDAERRALRTQPRCLGGRHGCHRLQAATRRVVG
jgi:hypothetical protein